MKAVKKDATKTDTPEQQLKVLLAKFEPEYQTLIRSVRRALRKLFPAADELVYDYSNSLVIGYSPTQRGSDAVVAIGARADGLRLYFNQGPLLPDPKKILLGSGKQTRFILLESARTLALPEVGAFLQAAHDQAKIPLRPSGRGRLIVKEHSAKKRPGKKRER